jgi:hypothetical protein
MTEDEDVQRHFRWMRPIVGSEVCGSNEPCTQILTKPLIPLSAPDADPLIKSQVQSGPEPNIDKKAQPF